MFDHANDGVCSRRALVKNGLVLTGVLAIPGAAWAKQKMTGKDLRNVVEPPATPLPRANVVASKPALASPRVVRPDLFRKAMAALDRHQGRVKRDKVAIVDFTQPSAQPRFHFVDLTTMETKTLRVTHGRGSDPSHSGFLQRFSNDFGSNASCQGAFLADDYYVGKHGSSQRLVGLDPTNDNALGRAIVIHSAWYANPDMLKTHGQLGRSEGCFAVAESDLDTVFKELGQGRMIYADKV